MSNETGYRSDELLIYKEADEGVIPSTIAKAFSIGAISLSANRNQRNETNTLLTNGGQASKTDTGGEDPSGSFELKCTPDWDVLQTQLILGEYTTKTTLNDAHATATAYTLDDVAILGGADTLICTTAGTTDADDTALLASAASGSTGDYLTDGTVTWILTKGKTAVYEYEGDMLEDLPTAGIIARDVTAQGGGITHERIMRGVSLSNMTIGKEQGGVIAKTSYNATAHGLVSDTQNGYTSPTVTSTVILGDTPYKRDDICITVDGVAPKSAPSFSLSVERNITADDAVECITVIGVKQSAKITTIGTPVVSGNLMARFSKEQFTKAFQNKEQAVVVTYKRPTGEFSQYTLPKVQLLDPSITYDTSKPVEIDVPLNAYGDNATKTLSYKVRSFLDYTK